MLKGKIELKFWPCMMYFGAEGYSGGRRCFNYVHILHGSFLHVSDACPIFFFGVSCVTMVKILCVLYRVPRLLAIR
jgi:hypothetical protein